MRKPKMKSSLKSKLKSVTKKPLKVKKTISLKKDSKLDLEESIPFGPWKIPTQRKHIAKIYKKRQTALEKGFCVYCCEWLDKTGITKEMTCPNCQKDLMECFENRLDKNDLMKKFKIV